MISSRHPFVVQLHFAFQCSYFWALVMEYCPNGDLQGCLLKHGTPGLLLEDAARFAGEVLLALEHLHGIRVIFRDLKLENVVIDSNWRAKVTDFGLAKKLYTASDANNVWVVRLCGARDHDEQRKIHDGGRLVLIRGHAIHAHKRRRNVSAKPCAEEPPPSKDAWTTEEEIA